MILFILYILGIIAAFGRVTAMFYEGDENAAKVFYPRPWWEISEIRGFIILVLVGSWISFLAGLIAYYKMDEKYLFKFSYRKLKKTYYGSSNEDNRKDDELP